MWGLSVYVWRVHKIDFTKLLTLDTTEDDCFTNNKESESTPEKGIVDEAIDMSIVYLFTIAIFTQQSRLNMVYKKELEQGPVSLSSRQEGEEAVATAPYYQYCAMFPVLFTVWFAYKLVYPWNKRRHYLSMLYKVCMAPFYPVYFVDSYVGDILTSLVKVLVRTATLVIFGAGYAVIMLVTGGVEVDRVEIYASVIESPVYRFGVVPLITLLPLWLRLVQCLRRANESSKRFPHFCNGLKYTSAFTVIAFATFQPDCKSNSLWVLSFVGATLFQYTWDITMDWGLIESTGAYSQQCATGILSNFRIRSELLLRPIGLYPLIMIVNLLLRFSWTLTLIPDGKYSGSLDTQPLLHVLFAYLVPIMAAVGIVRRMIWGFIRVEWEHIAVKNAHSKPLQTVGTESDSLLPSSVASSGETEKLEKMSLSSSADGNRGGFFSSFTTNESHISLPYVLQHAFTYLVVQFDFMASFVEFSSSSIFVESYVFGCSVLIILLVAAFPVMM